MNVTDLYKSLPAARHGEIVLSGDRLFFDGEEFAVGGEGELSLVRTQKGLEQKVDEIAAAIAAKSV